MRLWRRLPLRVRVTLAFAGAMAVVLALAGLLLFARFRAQLDSSIDQRLKTRAADIATVIERAGPGADKGPNLSEQGESFAQVLDTGGRVLDSSESVRGTRVLSSAELTRAQHRRTWVSKQVGEDKVRLLAAPASAEGQRLVIVTGTPLDARQATLSRLARLLLLIGPAVLLPAVLVGYLALAAALRPVERMRRRAEAITDPAAGERLPAGAADDELGRLAGTLNAMLDRIGRAFERERTFVADASHELRTPLAILKSELELALAPGRDREQLRAAVESASEETDRLVQLAEALLVIARADQGVLEIKRSEVLVAALLERVTARFAQRLGAHATGLTVVCEPALRCSLDELRIEQAVGNLIENAIRHAGTDIVLSATIDDRSGALVISVSDHGPGFPERFLPHAFERFSRADGARGRGGSGLGLAIVATIAAAHGGTASASTGPGGSGAVVTITIPASAASPDPGPDRRAARSPAGPLADRT